MDRMTDTPEGQLRQALTRHGVSPNAEARLAVPPVASPLHRGVGHHCFRVEAAGSTPLFAKVPAPDQSKLVSPDAVAIAELAGRAGVGPEVLWSDADTGVVALADLPAPWRYAKVEDLRDPETLSAIVQALETLHRATPPRSVAKHDARARLASQDALLRALPIERPPDYDWLLCQTETALAALLAKPVEPVPCHLGMIASNVMLGPAGAVQLVGFGQAGLSDPLHDIGQLLTETFDFEDEWRAILTPIHGADSERALHRARLWGIIDDVCWGQWGLICHGRALRPDTEFFKYACWRFMRAQMNASAWDFERRLRQI